MNESNMDLNRWMGRRDAFAAIAGRCSAADAECLRLIREQKLYLDRSPTWDDFCRVELHSSRRKIDNQLRLLEEFGPGYFQLRQLTRISEQDFRAIAPQVGGDGLRLDGEVIALIPENTERVSEAVSKLKAEAPKAEGHGFDALVRKCNSVASALRSAKPPADQQQKADLVMALAGIQKEAVSLGLKLPKP